MRRVFVVDANKTPLMPCLPNRARQLLKERKASVLKLYPFTIILKQREGGEVQKVEIKIDPGSKVSGIALVGSFLEKKEALWAANLEHKGMAVRSSLESRRALRRGRRHRKTRYRKARFDNRTRKEGWLSPSLQSRVHNVLTFVKRLQKVAPISKVALESVRFDIQKIQDPEITGIEYQQGELLGYEIREYLLEKWGRCCVYCGLKQVRLEIDHILPKSKGGTDRVSNLTISCRECNSKKSNYSLQEFLKGKPALKSHILEKAKKSFIDAAAVNSTRKEIVNCLTSLDLPVSCSTGGQTKFNRTLQGYPKDHWIDAACVGESGKDVYIPPFLTPLTIKAIGRGSRQSCRMDKYGFPRTSAKGQRRIQGFATGDFVKAVLLKGKKMGTHCGRVAIRTSGNFCIDTPTGKVDGIHYRFCQHLQYADGYQYYQHPQQEERLFLPRLKSQVSASSFL
jgi:5-methylcytosine-specific restriction endonuclease McrA